MREDQFKVLSKRELRQKRNQRINEMLNPVGRYYYGIAEMDYEFGDIITEDPNGEWRARALGRIKEGQEIWATNRPEDVL